MVVILLAGLSACARPPLRTNTTAPATGVTSDIKADQYWWYCRFKIDWPETGEIDLAVDLMLAHAVVGPVLRQHRQEIPYWRFHRRAAIDDAGHQFSFIFYTDPATATTVMADLHQSAILQQLLTGKILERASFDKPNNPIRPDLKDVSDPDWSIEIQRNWPAYIMGVSATWLGLIDDFMPDAPATTDLQELIQQYRQVHERITAMWRREGQHAFIHHLSAIFGYEPVMIHQEIQF